MLLLLLAGICGTVIATLALWRAHRGSTASLLSRLPSDGAIVLYLDFATLRHSRILDIFAASEWAQEPEYRSFVARTGFDYLHDLDSALVSFHRSGTYFLLRGKFNWRKLAGYIAAQGGSCRNEMCRVVGSTPGRRISFFPLRGDLMALAVSSDESAATRLESRRQGPGLEVPKEPVWSLIPIGALRNTAGLPSGAGMFVRALGGADRILLSLSPEAARMELRLDVTCRSAADAVSLATQLKEATARLRELIARRKQAPNPRELSGVLTAGTFEQQGLHVFGRWPFERAFLEALAGGGY